MRAFRLRWPKSSKALVKSDTQKPSDGDSVALVDELRDGLLKLAGVPNDVKERMKRFEELGELAASLLSCLENIPEGAKAEDLPARLQNDLEKLRTVVKTTQKTLEDRTSVDGGRSHLRSLLNGSSDAELLFSATERMRRARDQFIVSSLLDLRTGAARVEAGMSSSMVLPPSVHVWNVPPPPDVLHGREEEIANVCAILQKNLGARLAILGPPGIGKTAVAEAVINHPDVIQHFGARRYWVSCESPAGADGILYFQDHIAHLPLAFPNPSPSPSSLGLQGEPRDTPTLVVVDNLERIWDSVEPLRVLQVEALLKHLASVPCLSLIITMRGVVRPRGISWTRPVLLPFSPLRLRASVDLFLDVSGKALPENEIDWQRWGYDYPDCKSPSSRAIVNLLRHLDGIPLAITLMAHLAQCGTDEDHLLLRWEEESTSMLTQRSSSLHSLDISIKLSMDSPRLTANPNAAALLNALAFLNPESLKAGTISIMLPSLQCPAGQQSFQLLIELGLINNTANSGLTILAPIRAFLHQRNGDMAPYFDDLVQYCIRCSEARFNELSNFCLVQIAAILQQALTSQDQKQSTLRSAFLTLVVGAVQCSVIVSSPFAEPYYIPLLQRTYQTAARTCPSGAITLSLGLLLSSVHRSPWTEAEKLSWCRTVTPRHKTLILALRAVILYVQGPADGLWGLGAPLDVIHLAQAGRLLDGRVLPQLCDVLDRRGIPPGNDIQAFSKIILNAAFGTSELRTGDKIPENHITPNLHNAFDIIDKCNDSDRRLTIDLESAAACRTASHLFFKAHQSPDKFSVLESLIRYLELLFDLQNTIKALQEEVERYIPTESTVCETSEERNPSISHESESESVTTRWAAEIRDRLWDASLTISFWSSYLAKGFMLGLIEQLHDRLEQDERAAEAEQTQAQSAEALERAEFAEL